MTGYIVTFLLIRLLLPAALILSIGLRPFGLSFIYLLLLLLAPLLRIPDMTPKKGNRGTFLLVVLAISVIVLLTHVVWHCVLAGFVPYGSLLIENPTIERIAHNLGLVSYKGIDPFMATQYLAPELVMVGASVIVFVAVGKFNVLKEDGSTHKIDFKYRTFPMLVSAGKYLSLFLIMFSGILWPSITSGIYYLAFMGAATFWALDRLKEKAFAVLGWCLMAVMAVHSAVLIAYQCNYVTDLYPPDKPFARYFGLIRLVDIHESAPTSFKYDAIATKHFASLASPLVILVTYYVLGVETRELIKPKVVFPYIDMKKHRGSTSETTPLIRKASAPKHWSVRTSGSKSRRLRQDSTGSVLLLEDESDMGVPETTVLDDIVTAIIEFSQVLVRSSYIATTITMMAWSILYHSWLTFVFLMWANIVWLCQDQRRFMLKTSPIFVTYAMALLLAQYVYGMDITNEELPSHIKEVNLQQIGVGHYAGEPFVPLLIKSLFTCMFWVTLRQRVLEKRSAKQAAALADMAAPLQVTVSTAASAVEARKEEQDKSRILAAVGGVVRTVCVKYWIYVVVIMLFVIGIIGDRMTIFRIIYMFLFLTFILLFQISWYWWRKLMYMFWIIVIIYSMVYLILLYVYQFDNCPRIIEEYLFINEKLQHDLGLEPYLPTDLFVKLLTPTLFLIITIIQVHYFHKDFMTLSGYKSRSNTYRDAESSRPSHGASTIKDDIPQLPEDGRPGSPTDASGRSTVTSYNTAAKIDARKCSLTRSYGATSMHTSIGFRAWIGERYIVGRKFLLNFIDLFFEYLDIHLTVIIFVALMLLCVFEVCAMHVPIMIIICFGLVLNRRKQRACLLFVSILISVYFMAKMVYQIDYIQHSKFYVNCTNAPIVNTTNFTNNAEWVGFSKTSAKKPLVVLLKAYICLIAFFTFNSLVVYRQQFYRESHGIPEQEMRPMFPDIRREHADDDLKSCVKYLINYGFYKFGVEISLICLIGVIGSRMDLYAVVYAVWLLVLVSAKRPLLSRLWGPFTVFLIVIVPLQYQLAVGFLPQFCIDYPWSGFEEQISHIRNFCFLPYWKPPNALKLIFDYFLLVFAVLQLRVFNIEKTYGDLYPGGSNSEELGQDWETPTFENPVPDFLGFMRSWLDIVKRMVFLGMLWVTLAIMFMTGTNRVNVFSMGYLVGSFFFLWQGTDFYLLPRESILMWWSWLLCYNVSVVTIKTLLQVPGCIFGSMMRQNACWLVQLMGIGCVDKFVGGSFKMKTAYNARVGEITNGDIGIKTTCSVPYEDIGLAWDGVCFAFLILQRRLFHSYYFYRVIDESKATTILASRGAELIEELRQKQMVLQEEQELNILAKIKVKMEKIKANQKKIHGVAKEPEHHDAGSESESDPRVRRRFYTKRHEARDCPPYRPPASHQKAIRSGDYYMFEDFDDGDEPIKDDQDEAYDEDAPKQMGLGKLVSTVFKTDLRRALTLRRASMPSVPQRHSPSIPHSYAHETRSLAHSPHARNTVDDAGAWSGAGGARSVGGASGRMADARKTEDELLQDDDAENETWFDKLRRVFEAVVAIISSFLVSLTRLLMKYSRDYRYVSRMLTLEKKVLKEKEGFGIGLREGSQMRWEPLPETLPAGRKLSEISVPEIRILAPSMERGLDASPPSRRATPTSPPSPATTADDVTSEHESAFSLQSTESNDVSMLQEHDDSMFKHDRSPLVHLIFAAWYAILAHTDIVCYIMVFINQIQSATILSIPLPLMVFLWGTLTIPRPTKTFWVTLIAYTEVIVLIKSMFQFEILPWNQKVIPENMPFTAPRIIGIERKSNYALYDLLLLLIIFLHRFMLKSLGLWKESTPEIELREDMEFSLDPEDTQMLIEGKGAQVGKKYIALHDLTGPTKKLHEELDLSLTSKEERKSSLRKEGQPGPSGRPDEQFDVNDDQEPIISVTTTMDAASDHYPGVIWLSIKRYLRPARTFFKRMTAHGARVTADVYAYMFLCDFTNFLVVIFGFAAFGTHQGDGGVQTYLEENKVPIPFLVMLILQFVLIVIDRALYLRKFMLGKILFQYALIIGVHIWMFFILPFITERTFNTLPPPPLWYMVKCIYLLLSAYQIRCGYPHRIIGNFLCKSYRFLNMAAFRIFMAIPFVFELRTLMDWIWTDTSMTLMDWLKMEDIFANVYLLKCSRYMEDEFPASRGEKKPNLSKYLLGGTVLAFVIAIIWFPLVFFAFGNTVGEPNPPLDVTVKIRIGAFLPVYQMSAQPPEIKVFTEDDYYALSNLFSTDRTAQTFLSNYIYNDVAVVSLNPNSTMKWAISPPELERFKQEVKSNMSLSVKFTFVLTRLSNTAQNPPTIEDSRTETIPAVLDGHDNPERDVLYRMLTNNTYDSNMWLNVKMLFPKFLKVFNKGIAKPTYQLTLPPAENPSGAVKDSQLYSNVQLRLEWMADGSMYWRVHEKCTKEAMRAYPHDSCDMLVMYTFNDKLFPETLNFISGGGIIGLYTTFVFLASRVIRGFFSGIYTKIMFDDLPNVDRVLQLCLDIYLVREALELCLEEDLFAKLVFLYRSPETMIKWSRPREEEEDQRALPPPN